MHFGVSEGTHNNDPELQRAVGRVPQQQVWIGDITIGSSHKITYKGRAITTITYWGPQSENRGALIIVWHWF